jgi:hypothetical protein
MLRRFTVGGIAALVAIVVATMVAAVSPTEAAWKEKTRKNCWHMCEWKCPTISAFGGCLGNWVKRCGEEQCFRTTG